MAVTDWFKKICNYDPERICSTIEKLSNNEQIFKCLCAEEQEILKLAQQTGECLFHEGGDFFELEADSEIFPLDIIRLAPRVPPSADLSTVVFSLRDMKDTLYDMLSLADDKDMTLGELDYFVHETLRNA